MDNNQNNEKSGENPNTKPGNPNRRPNPHRTNSGEGQAQSPNRKSSPNRKPHPNRNQSSNSGQKQEGGQQQGQGNQSRKPQSNQNRRPNDNRKSNNQNRKSSGKSSGHKSGGSKGGGKRRRNEPTQVSDEMKKSILANRDIQEARLNPWKQIDINSGGKVRFTPLGGLGEIGGNIAVLETETTAVIIDVGMSFPDESMHGVDILVPDFSYLHVIKDKIKAIIITHAHEDHIGAVPYLFKELKFPIYGTPLALAMIENKFNEHGLKNDISYFNFISKRQQYEIGDFKVEWMHMTHSIIDACSLAIETPAGTLIHTGDFKIDHTPIDGNTADLHRFAHYGAKGVLCLFSDSTNSYNVGFTKSEAVVGNTFDTLYMLAKGRLLMSTFSSNVHRIYQAMERAIKHNRKICVIGRSMERNIEVTRALGYVDIPDKHFIEAHEINKYADNEVMIVTTGSQGEDMAALFRMATNEHRHIKLKPTDTIIISAKAIPGNEASVSRMMNYIVKTGATVRYQDFADIHVSGHAAQEEQKLILRLVQPKFFLPVHGEYNHIAQHAKTAAKCGVNERNILLMSDGDQVEITPKYLKKVKSVKTGKTFIDNQNNREIHDDVIVDRQKLASDGIVNVIVQISEQTHKLVGKPIVMTHGLVPDKEDKKFSEEVTHLIETFLLNAKPDQVLTSKIAENEIRLIVRKHVIRIKKLYPIIIPTLFYV
ncbi:MAG: ribonuclease J [Campylobacterota bacterium]|nr:ribonuclease J [Campylobacterota bacterium]